VTTTATPIYGKNFQGPCLFLGACTPNLRFASLATLELLAFNAEKFMGSHDPGHAFFSNFFSRSHIGAVTGLCVPNMKFIALAFLELLAFNSEKN